MQIFTDEKSYIYLRYNWFSTSQRLHVVAYSVAEQCRQSRGTGVRQINTDYAPAFNAVLTSLDVWGAYIPGQWIRIDSDKDIYSRKTQRSAADNRGEDADTAGAVTGMIAGKIYGCPRLV